MSKSVCMVCGLIWCLVVLLGCAYVVFVLGRSGWWFALGLVLLGWSCDDAVQSDE